MRAGALLRLCSNPGLHYQQGQRPGPGIREYFYYVDHQGQLFLDDTKVKNFVTCFKDVRFLSFFFRHLERNRVGRYQRRFPWVSRCGRERNFLRCSDLPVVFTQLLRGSRGSSLLSYCGGGAELAVPFQPGMLAVLPESGKDVRFLSFFFRHLERNRVGRYQRRFPWVSRCGRERNFLRCSDLPVVFTQLLRGSRGSSLLSYCGGGAELAVPFQPGMLAVLPESGKDVRFLSFFFRHLERNRVGRYQRRFPWVSRCGRERNFLRCSDLPVVFTQLLRGSRGSSLLSYCGGGAELAVPFQPGMLAVLPESGKDVRFLSFFFRHLERNRVGRYQRRFPWVSRCGRERNFLRCSDLPVVFTQLLRGSRGSSLLSYCGGGAELAVPFQPGMLAVLPESGKDVRFLSFFFRHLERNRVGRYQRRFPWVSRCGRERNFLRCSDLPVVFTQLLRGSRGSSLLSYCGGGAELAVPFQPGMLAVLPENGRLYHPAPERVGAVGLVRSALAQELSAGFRFRHGPEMPPTHFCWEGKEHRLAGDILGILRAQKAGAEEEEAISTS